MDRSESAHVAGSMQLGGRGACGARAHHARGQGISRPKKDDIEHGFPTASFIGPFHTLLPVQAWPLLLATLLTGLFKLLHQSSVDLHPCKPIVQLYCTHINNDLH